jgi:hypothetical protein
VREWICRVVVAMALGAALWPTPGLAAESGCSQVVKVAWSWIADPTTYMDRPRRGDVRKNELPLVWAEGHLVVVGDPASPMGALHRLVPEKFTVFAVLRRIRAVGDGTESEAAAEEAIDALYQAEDQSLADNSIDTPISHEQARALFERAVVICDQTGKATLPTVTFEVPPDE